MKHASVGIGIDITDGSFEASIVRSIPHGRVLLEGCVRIPIAESAIIHGVVHDRDTVVASLQAVLGELGMHDSRVAVACALPDTQVVVSRVELPEAYEATHDSFEMIAMRYAALTHPALNDPVVRWQFTPEGPHGSLMVFITRKRHLSDWRRILYDVHLSPAVIEMQSFAHMRGVVRTIAPRETIALLDLGYRHTSVAVFSAPGVSYSHAIDRGSYHAALTTAGDETPPAAQAASTFSMIADLELSKIQEQYDFSRLLVVGGESVVPGVIEYVARLVSVPVHPATPWLFAERGVRNTLPNLSPAAHHFYTASVGLAIRACGRRIGGDINFISTE